MTGPTRRAFLAVAAFFSFGVTRASCNALATPVPAPEQVRGTAPVSVLINNSAATPDRLIGATTPVAERVLLQATRLENGQRVEHQVSAIDIAADAFTSLEPGSRHLALVELRQSLVQGQAFSLTLVFEHAGSVEVEGRVRRKQDAAGVPQTPPVVAGALTILHASAPPASIAHD